MDYLSLIGTFLYSGENSLVIGASKCKLSNKNRSRLLSTWDFEAPTSWFRLWFFFLLNSELLHLSMIMFNIRNQHFPAPMLTQSGEATRQMLLLHETTRIRRKTSNNTRDIMIWHEIKACHKTHRKKKKIDFYSEKWKERRVALWQCRAAKGPVSSPSWRWTLLRRRRGVWSGGSSAGRSAGPSAANTVSPLAC